MWKEIRNNYYNEDEKATYIDAWETLDDNEEGVVITKVFDDRKIEFLDERAKNDIRALRIIVDTIVKLME